MRALLAVLFVAVLFFSGKDACASILLTLYDRITASAPNVTSQHTITFTTTKPIPPGGKIYIMPSSGRFTIPVDFDITDVDFAVATSTIYNERALATSASATEDGVAIITGTSGN